MTLLDENVEEIDFDRCARADIVGLTGMVVQRGRMRELLAELKRRGAFVVVGGPWATVKEDDFEGLADVVFVGEAEQTWPRFLDEWARGEHAAPLRAGRADRHDDGADAAVRPAEDAALPLRQRPVLARLPVPVRVLRHHRHLRPQAAAQDQRRRSSPSWTPCARQGVRGAFIVDDNLIGNKRAIQPVLRDLIAWQERHGYPMTFFTEASIDLAEDPELMSLMVEANIANVFVGIESPNEASLRETKKFQNVRPGGTLAERVRRIQDAGMEVWAG